MTDTYSLYAQWCHDQGRDPPSREWWEQAIHLANTKANSYRDVIKKIDPSKSPDGLCWTVVQRLNGETILRERFGTKAAAKARAHHLAGAIPGALIHLEGPRSDGGKADDFCR